MISLVYRYLQNVNIHRISKEDMHLQMLSHGDYPSLKAITDTLDYFGIDNIAANVPKEALTKLPSSFLGLVNQENGQELVQVIQNKNGITIKNDDGKTKKQSLEAFKKAWTGTIIAVEEEKKGSEKTSSKFGITSGVLLLTFLCFAISLVIGGFDLNIIAYIILSLVGIGLSIMIVKEDLGYTSAITQKVCGVIARDKTGCSSVIKSNQGKISKGVGLGDLCLVYFTGVCLVCTFVGVQVNVFYAVALLSLPVVAYSLYVQAFQLKEWCILCIGVGAVLIAQFGVLLYDEPVWIFSFKNSIHFLFFMMFLSALWFYVKPLLKKEKELAQVQTDFLKFKRNESFFINALEKGMVNNWDELESNDQVVFGNPKAAVKLTAYTDPLCDYCKNAFAIYDKLLDRYPDDIKIEIVFVTPSDFGNPSYQIVRRVLEFYDLDRLKAYNALKIWFSHRDIDDWHKQFGVYANHLSKYVRQIERHLAVSLSNEIMEIPDTMIFGCKYPRKFYSYDDLLIFGSKLKMIKEAIHKNQVDKKRLKVTKEFLQE